MKGNGIVTKIKTYYQVVLMLLLFMIGLLACGIPEFLGTSEENSPTSPCFELVPTPTPSPTPTSTPTPTPTPTSVTDYTLTVSYSDTDSCGGNIDPPGLSAITGPVKEIFAVTPGSSSTFTINYGECDCEDSPVYVDGNPFQPSSCIESVSFPNVSANHTLDAQFSSYSTIPMTYTITVSYSDSSTPCGGNIDPPGIPATTGPVEQIFTVLAGSSRIFTINYVSCMPQLSQVYVDKVLQPLGISSVSFPNVTTNHTLEAWFSHIF